MTRGAQRGAVLVVVISALAVIGAVVAACFTRGLMEARFAHDMRGEAEARALAQAGVACFLRRFLDDEDKADAAGESWLMADEDAVPVFPQGTVEVSVADHGSRLNLNLANEAALLAFFDGAKPPVDALLDWRDADRIPRPAGAEDDYYGRLSPALSPANGMFQCPEDVLLVKGMNEFAEPIEEATTVYGPANPNLVEPEVWAMILTAAGLEKWQADRIAEEFASVQANARSSGRAPFHQPEELRQLPSVTYQTVDRLRPYLTFKGQVNPNFACEPVLRAALALIGLKPSGARAIVKSREGGPFRDLDALRALLAKDEPAGVNKDWAEQVFTVLTTLASIEAVGCTSAGTLYRIGAIVERFHPPYASSRWRCRILAWREWPGQGFPGETGEEDGSLPTD